MKIISLSILLALVMLAVVLLSAWLATPPPPRVIVTDDVAVVRQLLNQCAGGATVQTEFTTTAPIRPRNYTVTCYEEKQQ